MPLKNRDVVHRAWNLLRLSLVWARKGGVLRRRVAMELRLVPKYLKRLGHTTTTTTTQSISQVYSFERELSFDKTPIFHVKMYRPSSMRFHLPHIPCINPHVDFEYDFDEDNDDDVGYDNGRKSNALIMGKGEHHDDRCQEMAYGVEHEQDEDGEGIDKRAEEFIAKFYQQMKLQRQISYLQYSGTPNRDTTTN